MPKHSVKNWLLALKCNFNGFQANQNQANTFFKTQNTAFSNTGSTIESLFEKNKLMSKNGAKNTNISFKNVIFHIFEN